MAAPNPNPPLPNPPRQTFPMNQVFPGAGQPPAGQPQGPIQANLETSINGQPNYNIGMNFDPALGDQAHAIYAGLMDDFGQANVPWANFTPGEATTQQVQGNQLMSQQLTDLLGGDSRYIQNARRRAMEAAGARGMGNSSIAAGAAERAAIEAGAPIAQFDAGRYGSVADQNMQAQNQMEAANLQGRTSLAGANLQAQAQAALQNARNRDSLAGMYLDHRLGGLTDYRRHMLGVEQREDAQAFQSGQADIDRFINERQFGQNLGLSNRQLDSQNWLATQEGLMQIANNIFANPELTAEQQRAAWNNVVQQVAPSIFNSAWNLIPPEIMSRTVGQTATNAVSRMPRMPPIRIGGRGRGG